MATKKPRLPMNALAATFHPGFKARPYKPKDGMPEYYVLPKPDSNEGIAEYLTSKGAVITTRNLLLPGKKEKHMVYVTDLVMVQKLEASGRFHGQYETFEKKTESGPIYPYQSPKQKAARQKANAEKAARKPNPAFVRA